jgi:D-sedoheptulose 7-phosphate isomerase
MWQGTDVDKTIRKHCDEAAAALGRMDAMHFTQIRAAAELILDCFRRGGSVYVCGNGGSAADAQHIAAELAGRFLRDRRALPCMALTTDTSILTAVGNDYSFERAFARQVEAYVRKADVVWVLSTSGNSPNILEAVREARRKEAGVLGLTGGQGGKLAGMCDVCFVAPADTSYGIQHLHQLAYHAICDIVEQAFEH